MVLSLPFPKLVQAQHMGFPFFPLSGIDGAGPGQPCSDIPTPGQLPHGKGQARLSSGTRVQPGEIWSLLKSLSIPSEGGDTL